MMVMLVIWLELSPKKIRMSVISHWVNVRKIPIEDVMKLSGHKWPSSVEMYRRKDAEEQKMLINKFHPLG
jgi:hypothetical protein